MVRGGGGGRAGQTGIGKKINGETENRQTDREDGRKNDDLFLHQLSELGGGLDRQA